MQRLTNAWRGSLRNRIVIVLAPLLFACCVCGSFVNSLPSSPSTTATPSSGVSAAIAPTAGATPISPAPLPSATQAKAPTAVPPTVTPQNSPVPASTATRDQLVRQAVDKALGTGNRKPLPRVAEVTVANAAGGQIDVTVKWAINDNLSEDWIRKGAKTDAVALFKGLYVSGLPVKSVTSSETFSLADIYGNNTEKVVVAMILDSATAKRINWAQFDSANIYQVADVILLNDLFKDR